MTTEDMKKHLFDSDVKFTDSGVAKWMNYKHPANPDFCNPVYWYAIYHEQTNSVTIKFRLGTSNLDKYYTHSNVKVKNTFEETVYDIYWAK